MTSGHAMLVNTFSLVNNNKCADGYRAYTIIIDTTESLTSDNLGSGHISATESELFKDSSGYTTSYNYKA